MSILVPNLHQKLANLQEGEKIIGMSARAGDEHNLHRLSFSVLEAEFGGNPEDMLTVDMSGIQVLRCGWIEEPLPDTTEGIHDPPLGKLWVVYKEFGTKKESPMERLDRQHEEEKRQTGLCREEVIQFLRHDTSSTRLQLAEVLRQQAEVIVAEKTIFTNTN